MSGEELAKLSSSERKEYAKKLSKELEALHKEKYELSVKQRELQEKINKYLSSSK